MECECGLPLPDEVEFFGDEFRREARKWSWLLCPCGREHQVVDDEYTGYINERMLGEDVGEPHTFPWIRRKHCECEECTVKEFDAVTVNNRKFNKDDANWDVLGELERAFGEVDHINGRYCIELQTIQIDFFLSDGDWVYQIHGHDEGQSHDLLIAIEDAKDAARELLTSDLERL